MEKPVIAFIGAGNMARCLIGGLIAAGYSPKRIWASNPTQTNLQELHSRYGIHTTLHNVEAAEKANVLVLAIKPQIARQVVLELAEVVAARELFIISVVAGISEIHLRKWLGTDAAIVRFMPNIPALIRSGATVLYANAFTSAEQKTFAETMANTIGFSLWLDDEALMPLATALSGSGPAYFFLTMEALQKAAVQLGMPDEMAKALTLQTALGSARMAIEIGKEPAELRR